MNSVDAVLNDMQAIHKICSISYDFAVMLRSPVINGDKKQAVVNEVLKGQNISPLTSKFITLLLEKGREQNLSEIADAFISQYNEMKNIRTVKLTTAAPVNEAMQKSIVAKVSGFMPNDSIDLKTAVDERLIGGFVLEVGDKLFDASVKKSLADLRSKVIDTSYVSKM
jgi:F-type H+-transporting ATPase subunit delta